MASTYKTPGVYVQEISKFPPSVAAVETAIPAFVGYTQRALLLNGRNLHAIPTNGSIDNIVPEAIRIESLLQYEQYFGEAEPETGITVTITEQIAEPIVPSTETESPAEDGTETDEGTDTGTGTGTDTGTGTGTDTGTDTNTGTPDSASETGTDESPGTEAEAEAEEPTITVLERTVTAKVNSPSEHNMYYAMQAYFSNGGGPCYVVSVGPMVDATKHATSVNPAALKRGIEAVAKVDEVTLFVIPESQALSTGDRGEVFGKVIDQCGKLQDRFAIFDMQPPATGESIGAAAKVFRNLSLTLENLKYAAAYTPNLETTFDYIHDSKLVNLTHQQIDPQGNTQRGQFDNKLMSALEPDKDDPTVGDAVLFNLAKTAIRNEPLILPPSPLVAGQYAQVDSTRGVFKAPANVALASVIGPKITITSAEQEGLNVDTSGKSINAIRAFTGKGTLIWGARTLDGNSNEWRYIPVRRFFNMAEESIKKATERFVFEPNDANTWTQVKAMIENFLTLQWRAGALAGAKPEQAFYVKVGLNATMTALDILEGRMIVEIGMAVVRPAEFIILKFSHKMQES